jgi:HD superfamily phosphohydrolase
MKIFDPLYGEFSVPPLAAKLILSPEIRRLSQIRLLNSLTPSLATLGELRRFSHTLGVLHLFTKWKHKHSSRFDRNEIDALEVAILLHDVATPPFAHLFEYILKEEQGWDHEKASSELFRQHHAPENSGHQIFAGQTPKIYRSLQKLRLSNDAIDEILQKRHQLSPLIMGSLDFDNIDNVWRMAWALGLTKSSTNAVQLAESINVTDEGGLIVPTSSRNLLVEWADLRRRVYEILVFDSYTVAGQAVLTKALRLAISEGFISSESWTLTDEDLLRELSRHPTTKKLIAQQYLGELPSPLTTIQLRWKNTALFDSPRQVIENAVRCALEQVISGDLLIYVFKEKGSFSKRIVLYDEFGIQGEFGDTTRSLVIYVLGSENTCRKAVKHTKQVVNEILTTLQCDLDDILKISGSISDDALDEHSQLFS